MEGRLRKSRGHSAQAIRRSLGATLCPAEHGSESEATEAADENRRPAFLNTPCGPGWVAHGVNRRPHHCRMGNADPAVFVCSHSMQETPSRRAPSGRLRQDLLLALLLLFRPRATLLNAPVPCRRSRSSAPQSARGEWPRAAGPGRSSSTARRTLQTRAEALRRATDPASP